MQQQSGKPCTGVGQTHLLEAFLGCFTTSMNPDRDVVQGHAEANHDTVAGFRKNVGSPDHVHVFWASLPRATGEPCILRTSKPSLMQVKSTLLPDVRKGLHSFLPQVKRAVAIVAQETASSAKTEIERNAIAPARFPVDLRSVGSVVLTHAHLTIYQSMERKMKCGEASLALRRARGRSQSRHGRQLQSDAAVCFSAKVVANHDGTRR